MDKAIQKIGQAKMKLPKFPYAGKIVLSANIHCFLEIMAALICQISNMALNSDNRLKSKKFNTPKHCRQPCTADPAQNLDLGSLSRREKLSVSAKIATRWATNSITNSGVFGQLLTKNCKQKRVTGFGLSGLSSLKIFFRKMIKQQKVVGPKGTVRKTSSKPKMSPAFSKEAKFKAKMINDDDLSDQEMAQNEHKIETELDISMSSISEEEADGKINLFIYSRKILRSNLNPSNKKKFSNFLTKITDRRIEDTFKNKTNPQGPAKPGADRRFQIFIGLKNFLKNENFQNNQNFRGNDGPNKNQRSFLIKSKIRIPIEISKFHMKSFNYILRNLNVFHKIKIEITDYDYDYELPFAEMSKEKREQIDRKLWMRKFPNGIPPYPTPFSPETEAYWQEWAEARGRARREMENLTEEEANQFAIKEPEDETSSTISTRPAAIPKAEGRCKEGRLCPEVDRCSCVYDTASSVTMGSPNSTQGRSLSLSSGREGDIRQGRSLSLNSGREGDHIRPGTPDPRYDPNFDFTISDLALQVGVLEDQDKPKAPSIIWTDDSVQSTLPSVIETTASIVSTMPSIVSTTPSVIILDEIDWRTQCKCGASMTLTERAATWEFAERYPAPFICHDCRWATVGL